MRVGKFKEALQYLQNSASYYTQANLPSNAIRLQITMCGIMNELGLYSAALEEANKAVSLARSNAKSQSDLAAALAALGNAQYDLCEYAAARKTYEQSLQTASQASIEMLSNGARANIDLGYGFALAATGDLDMSRQVFERSLPALKTAGSIYGQAQALNALGIIEELDGQHGKAIAMLNQSLDLQPMINPRQTKLDVITLQNLAAVESRAGKNRDAREHLETALQVLKNSHDSLLRGRTYSGLAEVMLRLVDPIKAESSVRKAIEVSEKIADDAALWRDYTLLAQATVVAKSHSASQESLNSALSHFRSPQAGVFPDADRSPSCLPEPIWGRNWWQCSPNKGWESKLFCVRNN